MRSLSLIVVTPLYAFYRIKKFKRGILVIPAIIAIDMLILTGNGDINWEEFLTEETVVPIEPIQLTYGYANTLLVDILLPLYFARKWTIEYNERIETSKTQQGY